MQRAEAKLRADAKLAERRGLKAAVAEKKEEQIILIKNNNQRNNNHKKNEEDGDIRKGHINRTRT